VAEFGLKATTSLAGLALPGRYGRPDGEPGCYIAERSGLVLKQIGARRRRTNEVLRGACEALGLELADAPMAVAQGAKGRDLLARLENALKGFATFVDQSDAKAVLRFWGRNARDVLAKGCPLDLHERAFHPQDAATTQIALISCLLWQLDEAPTFELAVPLSYVGSFWSWLTASAAEFGYEVTPLSLDESLR
jgi:heterotetrameric sarcosine oxidase gamma subunit